MQTRGRTSLIVYFVSWQLPCNYFYWHQEWWPFVPQTYFSFSLPPYRSLDLKDCESWTKGPGADTLFTYRIQQYCWKESSLAVTYQSLVRHCLGRGSPKSLWSLLLLSLRGLRAWRADCQTYTAKGILFFTPGLQQSRSALNLPVSFRLIWGNKYWCLR